MLNGRGETWARKADASLPLQGWIPNLGATWDPLSHLLKTRVDGGKAQSPCHKLLRKSAFSTLEAWFWVDNLSTWFDCDLYVDPVSIGCFWSICSSLLEPILMNRVHESRVNSMCRSFLCPYGFGHNESIRSCTAFVNICLNLRTMTLLMDFTPKRAGLAAAQELCLFYFAFCWNGVV